MKGKASRNRVIVFRVSEVEYRRLQEACVQRGGRNLSDFTRSKIFACLDESEGLQQRLSSIERRISELQSGVSSLVSRMHPLAAAQAHLLVAKGRGV